MTPKERVLKTLNFEEPDRPPHFELQFQLTEEAFGLSFPSNEEILAATGSEREKLFEKCAEIYAKTVEKYKWDAVVIWTPAKGQTSLPEFTQFLKKYLGDDIPVIPCVWNSTVSIETVQDYMQFSIDMVEEPEKIHKWAQEMCDRAIEDCRQHIEAGADIICLPSDCAFNAGPFLSPKQFSEFTAPYLKKIVEFVQGKGVKTLFHTDGYLMPIIDQIIEIGPDILQSIDPMAGMDIAKVKELTYGKIVLMGNVQCSLLQDGPKDKIQESADYALKHGIPGGGFIYSSSNTIFKGLPLENYEVMVECLNKYNPSR